MNGDGNPVYQMKYQLDAIQCRSFDGLVVQPIIGEDSEEVNDFYFCFGTASVNDKLSEAAQ